jgi:hypothetical protein
MCIACEMAFMEMFDALEPAEQERILREQAARFTCEAPPAEPPLVAQAIVDERKP